jgi:ATP-dependent Lon protease
MEIIRLPGYIEDEKLNIAKNYLVPRNQEKNGLKKNEISFSDNSILKIIRNYTREAGVRSLDREINKICRKKVKEISLKGESASLIDNRTVRAVLGPEPFKYGQTDESNQKGQVNGLAWTSVGGELLQIESAVTAGKGRVIKTGSLGDVMQESIQAAMTVSKNIASENNIDKSFFETNDIHIHVPEGATPKDGPSAGITMCTAITSIVLDKLVKANLAMTGEITLAGKVLKIGGLKEKLIAAKRSGITNIIIPKDNVGDLEELDKKILKNLKIIPVESIKQVLAKALV